MMWGGRWRSEGVKVVRGGWRGETWIAAVFEVQNSASLIYGRTDDRNARPGRAAASRSRHSARARPQHGFGDCQCRRAARLCLLSGNPQQLLAAASRRIGPRLVLWIPPLHARVATVTGECRPPEA